MWVRQHPRGHCGTYRPTNYKSTHLPAIPFDIQAGPCSEPSVRWAWRNLPNHGFFQTLDCCWNVAGFALAKTLGGGPVVIAGSHLNLSDEEILQSALEHQPPEGMPIYAGIFPWSLVLALAIRYLAKLVENA